MTFFVRQNTKEDILKKVSNVSMFYQNNENQCSPKSTLEAIAFHCMIKNGLYFRISPFVFIFGVAFYFGVIILNYN